MKLMGRSDGLLIVFVFSVSSEVFKLNSDWTEGRGHMVRPNIFLLLSLLNCRSWGYYVSILAALLKRHSVKLVSVVSATFLT